MWCRIITVALLFSTCIYGYEDCGSEVGTIKSVKVSDCDDDDSRCILKRNTNITMEFTFISNVTTDVINSVVHGVILGVPIRFDLPNSDGCKDSGITCPLSVGETYTYINKLPVLSSYPRVTVDVKWELQDKDGKDLVCILIPSKIK